GDARAAARAGDLALRVFFGHIGSMSPAGFHPAVQRWFETRFREPTEPQRRAWPLIQGGRDVLIAAPTGSGKTFAAFLAAIDGLVREGLEGTLRDETQVVYVSPLKALSNDRQKNLSEALAGRRLQRVGLSATQKPIDDIARFLVGNRPLTTSHSPRPLGSPLGLPEIIDTGHTRTLDLAIEIPSSPLEAVMAGEVWEEIYERLAQLIAEHRTTPVFVNTRKLRGRP